MTDASPDYPALRRIGWPWPDAPEAPAWQALFAEHPQARPARVVEQHRSGYVVADSAEASLKAESLPEWQRPRFPSHERAAVGDWVLMEGKRIVALLPRRTAIKRGAAGEHYHQQVIAANIDTVFIVCGLDADFNPRRIERYLLLVGGGGAAPVVVLTKADQTEYGEDALAVLEDLAAQGIPLLAVNGKDPASVAALAPWLGAGRTAVLVGSSGAGKSTL
ncbi:MAG TPA: GTPase RsgA, partial [Xanthomonadaceae bacterium]|nr:GTPase RsgA [Xanthomonadaceae bacterium]